MIVIDTGTKGGAIHFTSDGQFRDFFKFEKCGEVFLNMFDFHDWLCECNDNEVLIERIPAMPKQSVVSTSIQFFHVGSIYTTVLIALDAIGLELKDVYPRTWASGVSRVHNELPDDARTSKEGMKYVTEAVAKHYFPEVCKKYTKRTRVDDALTDCFGIWIWYNINDYLTD